MDFIAPVWNFFNNWKYFQSPKDLFEEGFKDCLEIIDREYLKPQLCQSQLDPKTQAEVLLEQQADLVMELLQSGSKVINQTEASLCVARPMARKNWDRIHRYQIYLQEFIAYLSIRARYIVYSKGLSNSKLETIDYFIVTLVRNAQDLIKNCQYPTSLLLLNNICKHLGQVQGLHKISDYTPQDIWPDDESIDANLALAKFANYHQEWFEQSKEILKSEAKNIVADIKNLPLSEDVKSTSQSLKIE